jgi:hypothetical protein
MEIGRPARRHGLSNAEIAHAVSNAVVIVEHPDGLLFIGAGRSGRLIEALGRMTDEGLYVFHAMPLRPINRRYLP